MSTTDPNFDPDDFVTADGRPLQAAQTSIKNAELRVLKREAAKARDLEAKITEFERREAFARAGVDLNHPGAEYLIRGFQGELVPEVIRAEAVKIGIIPGTAATPEEQRAQQFAQAAATGGTPPSAAPDLAAKLAEMGKKTFAPSDDIGREQHIRDIVKFARDNDLHFPVT
jgi:ribosomal protein L12E/L44/L45/RPP1/RPP2